MIILSHWYIFLVPGIIFFRKQNFSFLIAFFESFSQYRKEPPQAYLSSFFYEEECLSTPTLVYKQCRVHKKTGIRYIKMKNWPIVLSDGKLSFKDVWYPEEQSQRRNYLNIS